MSLFLFVSFYLAMVLAALAVEGLFGLFDWVPTMRNANVGQAAFTFNYTTVLNIFALMLAGWLYLRYRRTGGPQMMKAMAGGGEHRHHHEHQHQHPSAYGHHDHSGG
jgi:ABC-type nickel/cobalt efflux system permease component RcnA